MDAHLRVLSTKKFHLILFMWHNGNVISFKKQDIYRANPSFKRAMRDLHDRKIVKIKQLRTGNRYKLTAFGEHIGGVLNQINK